MANIKRGQVKIKLDKERILYFDLNALVALEELGIDMTKLGEGVKMSQIRGIIWAGLKHEDNELTIEEVGAMITLDNMQDVSDSIAKAFASEGKK